MSSRRARAARVWAALALAACGASTEHVGVTGDAARECAGCHTAQRVIPSRRFENGLGLWRDDQCYGCHAEINDVAIEASKGQKDARYVAVPVSAERLATLVTRPLAYMAAPERVEPRAGRIARIALPRLGDFLRRPASSSPPPASRAPRMMAYPRLSVGELASVAHELGVAAHPGLPAHEGSTLSTRARSLWRARCASCHDGLAPSSGRGPAALALYTPEWLAAYAADAVETRRPGRRMPVVPLSRAEAEELYVLLGELRRAAERDLDAHVERLALAPPQAGEQVPSAFVRYLWGRFFRDATCVHCHATSARAAAAFRADAAGLADFLRRRPGSALWRRLEIRALEAEHGLGAATPGMPMAGAELPAVLRAQIGRWVRGGCIDPDAVQHCAAE